MPYDSQGHIRHTGAWFLHYLTLRKPGTFIYCLHHFSTSVYNLKFSKTQVIVYMNIYIR